MMWAHWSFQKFKIWAIIYFRVDAGVYLPIGIDLTSFEFTHKLNEIPSASMEVAVGRDTRTLLAANIHYIFDFLRVSTPIQIWMEAKEFSNSINYPLVGWPEEPIVIFEGVTSGVGMVYSKEGNLNIKIQANHWIGDLNFSSAISRMSHVSNPSHFYAPSSFFIGAGGLGSPAWVSQGLMGAFLTPPVIDVDIWSGGNYGFGLMHFLFTLCSQDMFFAPDLGIFPDYRRKNDEALAALMRFEPIISTPPGGFNWFYQYGVPLSFRREAFLNYIDIDRAMTQSIMSETFMDNSQITLWDKIISWKSNFLFSIVPMTDRALIVPYISGMFYIWQIITPGDYSQINIEGKLPRSVRGFGLLLNGPTGEAGGFTVNQGKGALSTSRVGGYYENPLLPEGMIIMRKGPSWLSIAQPSETTVLDATGVRNNISISNALYPGIGVAPQTIPPVLAQRFVYETIANEFARAAYVEEALKHRTGVISGRPRFDIAPGSSVAIIVIADKFVGAQIPSYFKDKSIMFGTVVGITNYFNSITAKCGSNILLSNLKTIWEHYSNSYSVLRHPLWRFSWIGAPLHPHPIFIPR